MSVKHLIYHPIPIPTFPLNGEGAKNSAKMRTAGKLSLASRLTQR